MGESSFQHSMLTCFYGVVIEHRRRNNECDVRDWPFLAMLDCLHAFDGVLPFGSLQVAGDLFIFVWPMKRSFPASRYDWRMQKYTSSFSPGGRPGDVLYGYRLRGLFASLLENLFFERSC